MFTQNHPKTRGYNVYVEHSIPNGELAKMMALQILQVLDNTKRATSPTIVPYVVSEPKCDERDAYLHNYIKENTKVHTYVMVPGTNIFCMIADILESAKHAAKTYVVMLQEHPDEAYLALGVWTEAECEALRALKPKLMSMGDIVVVDSFEKMAASIEFTINNEQPPTYRSPQDRAIKDASEKAAQQIIDSAKKAIQ